MPRRPFPHSRRLAVALLVALVAGLLVACTPPKPPEPQLPGDIKLMTDAQVAEVLAEAADDIATGWASADMQRDVPGDLRPQIEALVRQLQTPEGRLAYVDDFRKATDGVVRGLPKRSELAWSAIGGLAAGLLQIVEANPIPPGTRLPPPSGAGATDGASVQQGAPSTAPCKAPQGVGTVPVPTDVQPGQLLTPQHDVYTRTSTGIVVGQPGPLSVAGVEPVAGQGPGIELRGAGLNAQEMKVRIHLQDPKGYGPGALYPLINLKPIGGTAAEEFRATIVGGGIYCYEGDTSTTRGYFEGWVRIPRSEPGFQVIAEVVENDAYFALRYPSNSPTTNPRFDVLLAASGPQYWAGADRSTVHAGADPLSRVDPLPKSVGAFVTSSPDPGDGPNALTDTNGQITDDIEAPIRGLITSKVLGAINDAVAGDLLQWYVLTLQATLNKSPEVSVDLRFTTPHDGFTVNDEPVGPTGALRLDASIWANAKLYAQFAGIPCFGMTATVTGDISANVWADSDGNGTGLKARHARSFDTDVDIDMPYLDWLDPTCVLARAASLAHIDEWQIESKVDDALDDLVGNDGTVTKLLRNLDLNAYLPTVSLGTANIKPLITDIDNAWCSAAGAPAGCNDDQDLIGDQGVEVVADTTMISSLGQAIGGALGGRFRNVFSPTTQSTAADLTASHRNASAQKTALGIVIDPRLINLTLRHLVQGSSTNRTTNGLLDVASTALPVAGWSLSTRPEVAPVMLGVPPPPPVVCDGSCPPSPFPNPPWRSLAAVSAPDVRVGLKIDGGAPIQFSIATSVNAGAGFDAATKKLRPLLDSPQVDFLITGGCKANYTSAYALSYTLCGRGRGGNGATNPNGSQISLTDVVSYVVNSIVLPLLTDSIGGVSLPSLDGIVPNLHVSLDNVHSQQRGGFLAVYANLRPTPRVEIAISTERMGDVDYIRFFPRVFNIDATMQGTQFSWQLVDVNTGQPVASVPHPFAPTSAVMAPYTSFALVDDNLGEYRKVRATLTFTQPSLQVSATLEQRWSPPSLPPPSPCAPGGGGFLRAAAVSGGAVGPSAQVGC